jgi:hypothetical protein
MEILAMVAPFDILHWRRISMRRAADRDFSIGAAPPV